MKAPFPWFGGKSRAAPLVWQAFGDVPNYVEPFAGSLAVLLSRPTLPRVETVNDLDCYLANFWRAVQHAPEGVARHADWPVNEADLHARHRWLVDQAGFRERMKTDPEYFDAKIAGWWVWGICQWIGSGWCAEPGWRGRTNAARRARGIHAKRPLLGRGDRGVQGAPLPQKKPILGGGSKGVHAQLWQQKPDLSGSRGAAGRGIRAVGRHEGLYAWMEDLSARLRRVRVCCGDWKRVVGPAATECIGVTGVLLDPPYADTAERTVGLYSEDSLTVAHEVREWALANGDNPKLRIALCGYEGEHEMPSTWRCVAWKAHGGYGATRADGSNDNAQRERIWLSPHCEPAQLQRDLFASGGAR